MKDKILLVSVDSEIPNLAALQVYTYYKSWGHQVGFNIKDPDIVYIFCVFSKNRDQALGLKTKFPKAREIHIGGSGIDFTDLPEEMLYLRPDYSLYDGLICIKCGKLSHYCKCLSKRPIKGDMPYSLGRTTEGCIRNCKFCIVQDKEGPLRRTQHIRDFWNPKHKEVMLLDNNWIADKNWFFENSQYLIDNKISYYDQNGIDARLLDEEIATQLKKLKLHDVLHFAWDRMEDEKAILRGIDILKQAGFNMKRNVSFYVLVDFDTEFFEDLHRCRKLKSLGTSAYVMPYQQPDTNYPPKLNNIWIEKMARWVNRREVYWDCDYMDYTRRVVPEGYIE